MCVIVSSCSVPSNPMECRPNHGEQPLNCSRKINKTAGKDKARRPDKLSLLVTKQLWEKLRQMKRNETEVQ